MLSIAHGRIPACTASTSRTYVISTRPPLTFPRKPVPRVFVPRKTYLYNQYTHFLQASSASPLLFLYHRHFNAQTFIKLRRDITAAAMKKRVPSLASGDVTPAAPLPQLVVIRTGVFGVALRDVSILDVHSFLKVSELMKGGGVALLQLPSLDPPQLQAILRAVERVVPKRGNVESEKPVDEYTPGRRQKRIRPTQVPEMSLLGAVVEGKLFQVDGVQRVSSLPSLDSLRAQIIGLLSSPGMQLAGVLSQASGGRLARTLEGLKRGLEESGDSVETHSSCEEHDHLEDELCTHLFPEIS